MIKTMKLMLMALLTVGFSMPFVSCNDDELSEEEKNQQTEKAIEEAQEWWDVVSQLTDVQAFPDDWQTATFDPSIGMASEDDPYTRVIATNDLSTAAQRFSYLTGCPVDENTKNYTWTHKKAGSLTYHAGSPEGTYLAQVDVNLKQMPKLKKILYQTPDQMGENASGSFSGTAYYRFGDVVKKKNSDGNWDYWVCVRPAFSLEGKGDSHWICLNKLPNENIYTYTYDKKTWKLPTKLGESKEHMQNFAEMLFAIYNPTKYWANLGYDHDLKVFHDFDRARFGKYHNQYFWENVSKAWDENNIFSVLFNNDSKLDIWVMLLAKGLTFIYKGYSWVTSFSWNCSLWQANYKGANLKTATYTTNKANMEDVTFDIQQYYNYNDDHSERYQEDYNKSFFGDRLIRYIVRYANGETLCKDANGNGKYNVKSALSNCEDVYVYNKYFYRNTEKGMYDLNDPPEITPEK